MRRMIGVPINVNPAVQTGLTRIRYPLTQTLNAGIGLIYLAHYASNPKPNARIYPVYPLPLRVQPMAKPDPAKLANRPFRGMTPWPKPVLGT